MSIMTEAHPNHPVLSPDDDGDRKWRRLSIGETIRWYHQAYVFSPRVGWRLTACAGIVNDGRATYRSPRSVTAWAIVGGQLVARAWRRLWA